MGRILLLSTTSFPQPIRRRHSSKREAPLGSLSQRQKGCTLEKKEDLRGGITTHREGGLSLKERAALSTKRTRVIKVVLFVAKKVTGKGIILIKGSSKGQIQVQ